MGYSQGYDYTGSGPQVQNGTPTYNGINFKAQSFYNITYGTKNYVTLGAYSSGTLGADGGVSVTSSVNLYMFLKVSLSLWKFGSSKDFFEVKATKKQRAAADEKKMTLEKSKLIYQNWDTVVSKVTNTLAITQVNKNRFQSCVSYQDTVMNKADAVSSDIKTTATANRFCTGMQRYINQKAGSLVNQTKSIQSQLNNTKTVITTANASNITCSDLMML
ncbi:hypothetical protein [uncultured Shewanella sp.]|uniref:hypothetical protein n=1 Tax=uncultured Shewanella sp. TaxID=173975 RepID=UPI00262C6C19|nr:hypothetical protein [uncultured Shewanella sp.]